MCCSAGSPDPAKGTDKSAGKRSVKQTAVIIGIALVSIFVMAFNIYRRKAQNMRQTPLLANNPFESSNTQN